MIFLPAGVVTFVLCTFVAVKADEGRLTNFPLAERPEGITNGPGSTLLVGQILSGKVLSIDAITGETTEVVGEQTGRQAWGLWYYKDSIFVAGGGPAYGDGTAELYAYNATSGELLASCAPVSTGSFGSFVNDVTVVGSQAFATDSFNGKLMSMDADQAIAGTCNVSEVDLPDNFNPESDADWSPNGLVEYAGGLLVVHETDGSVWHIGNLLGETPVFQEVIPDGGAVFGDGLNILDDKLFVTQNFADSIGVFRLAQEGDNITATFLGNITSEEYSTPATSALFDGYIYSTNSRFADLGNISAPADNNVVGVENAFAVDTGEDSSSAGSVSCGISASLGIFAILLLYEYFLSAS